MESHLLRAKATAGAPVPGGPGGGEPGPAAAAVTALYRSHALGLIRLAHIMLGDRASAEDVVQEAFCGLYRRWDHLADSQNALRYVRACVLNGCRSVLRRRRPGEPGLPGTEVSAEAAVLSGEERRRVMRALRRLPPRQRETLVLRFYLDLSDEEIAATMGIGASSVRSATHRALASLGKFLGEDS